MKDSVTAIRPYSFEGYPSLQTVNFPQSLEVIGAFAFRGCSKLTRVVVPPRAAFNKGAFARCSSLTSIGSENADLISRDGVLLSKIDSNSYNILQYPCGKGGDYTID